MSISYPSIIIGGLTSNTGSFSGSFYGNLSGSGLTTQITSSLISGSEGYFEELYINGVPVGTGGGISAISSSDNLTGSGLGSDPVKLLPNISLTSVTASVSGATAQFNTLNVLGTLTANELHVTYETSSVIYTSGSTKFGDSLDDTHQFTGSLFVSGNITANSITASYFSGTFVGDGSGLSNVPSVDLTSYVTTSSFSSSINQLTASISSSFLQSADLNDYVTTSSYSASINQLTASISSSFLQSDDLSGYATVASLSAYVTTSSYSASIEQLTASISSSFLQLDDLTASNISNFQQDVRAQFSAGTNIVINNGVISASASGGGLEFVYTTGSITGSGLIGDKIRLTENVVVNTLTASVISASSIAVDNSLVAFNTIDTDVLQVNQQSSLTGSTNISGTINLLGYATYNGVELNTGGGAGFPYAGNAVITGTLLVTNWVSASNISASNITSSEINADYIDLVPLAADPTQQTGRLFVDNVNNEVNYWSDVSGVKFYLGQQLVLRAKSTLSTFNKGQIVRINGGVGANATFTTASWDNDSSSADTIGLLMNSGVLNDFAYILLNGYLTDINTDGYTAGQMLYLSSSGAYTNQIPQPPYHEVRVGQVIRVHQNVGSIYVRIQNGYEIGELHDVYTSTLNNGDLLVYESSPYGQWTNKKQLSGSYGLTGSLAAMELSSSAGFALGNTSVLRPYADMFSQGIVLTSGSVGSVGIGSGAFSSGIMISGSGTGSFIAPNLALTASNSITAYAPNISVGNVNTNITTLNGNTITVGGTTLASLYAANGLALISGTLGVTINASGTLGVAAINMSASAVNISAPVIANSFTGDGSGLYNLPPAGLSHIQIPLAYNQTTTNTVDTLVGGGKINGTYYITKTGTFEILGYVANSGSDKLEVELYNISDSVSEAILSLSSSVTTAVSAQISGSFGAMPKLYEVYIRNSTGTGNVTLLSANMLID